MSVHRNLKDLKLEFEQFLEIVYKLYGPFDRSIGFMQSDLNHIQIDMLGQIFFQIIQIIDLIERQIEHNFLKLFEL